MPILVAIVVALLVAVLLPMAFFGAAEQEKARVRRMAAHQMNARLLRFNL
jgi:flagellar basal body-associated protein FliL